jgi:hypothetical protein
MQLFDWMLAHSRYTYCVGLDLCSALWLARRSWRTQTLHWIGEVFPRGAGAFPGLHGHSKQITGIDLTLFQTVCVYVQSVQNIKNTFLILRFGAPPPCPQNSLNSSWHGLYKESKAFHRNGPCLLQCFPQLSSWLDDLWVEDHSWYTQETEREKPSSIAVLDTNQSAWHLLPYPVKIHLNILARHSPSGWHT